MPPNLARTGVTHLFDLRATVLAAAGFSATETAWLLDTSRASVNRARHRMGLAWKTPDMDAFLGDAARVVRDPAFIEAALQTGGEARSLYDLIADMKPTAAIEHLVSVIEDLLWTWGRDSLCPAPGLLLTPLEARILRLLDRRCGSLVAYENLIAGVYAEVPEDRRPQPRALAVSMCSLRKKIAAAGIAADIITEWGVGFRLKAAPGTFDWSA